MDEPQTPPSGDGTTTPDPTPGADPPGRDAPTLTQRQFDFELAKRIREERAKFADYDEVRAKAAQLDQIEEERKDELTKLSERADKAEAERDQAKQLATRTLRKAAIVSSAAEQGVDPEIVYALLLERDFKVTEEDRTHEVTVAEDGETVTGMREAINALVTQKGLTASQAPPPRLSVDPGARQEPPATQSPEEQHAELVSNLLGGRQPQT
jgi:hypothetical protein